MKYKFIVLSFLVLSLTGFRGFGQAPSNDDYTGAIALTVNPGYTCSSSATGTTANATKSGQAAHYNNLGYHDDDVWYSFVATHWSHLVKLSNFNIVVGTGTSRFIEIFEEGIEVVTIEGEEIHIPVPKTKLYWSEEGSSVTERTQTHLTIGKKYYVRVYSSGTTARINFNICLLTPPAPPANDEFAGAFELPVNPAYNCVQSLTGNTTDGASLSSQEAQYNSLGYHDDDVWFKFTATSFAHLVKISNVAAVYGTGASRFIEIFEGDGTGGLITSRLYWSNESGAVTEKTLTHLTIGKKYYVRVYSYSTITRITFDICLLTPPAPPVNDEFTGAFQLTVNPSYDCTFTSGGNTDGASLSSQAAYFNSLGYHDDDIWFKFTAIKASQIIRLSNVAAVYGSAASYAIEVFEENEGALVTPRKHYHTSGAVASETTLTGLTPGKNYYIRVYSDNTITRISFTLCVVTPIDPPTNDEYENAISVTVNTNNVCTNTISGTTEGATPSRTIEAYHDNLLYHDDDVWFSFVAVSASHSIRITGAATVYGSSTSHAIEIFRSEDNVPLTPRLTYESAGNSLEVVLAGLQVGETYLIRLYTPNTNSRINFNICILTPPVPANDDCTAAVDISNGSQASGTTNGATQSMSAGSCAGNGTAYDVWYKVIPVSDGALTVVANSSQFDLVLEAFTGTCGALTSIACKNDAAGSESLTIANATTGTTYYFRVYNYTPAAARVGAETGAFTIQVSGGALPVSLASFKAYLSESNSVRLDWATTEEAGASHFEVEHSLTGKTWSKIGELKAAGNNTGLKSYTYIHTNPSLSVNYYRLKSVDLDGTSAYSAIENVRPGIQPGANAKALYAYPNPVSDRLYLKGVNLNDISGLKLYSAAGNQVTASVDIDSQSLDVRQLPAGVYLLQVDKADGTSETVRVLISR